MRAVAALCAVALPAGAAHAETWHTFAAMRNDVFSEALPPYDDQGFTHDNLFSLRRQDGALSLGGAFLHRWITSTRDRRRWDQVELVALAERVWPHRITTGVRLGPTFGGNFGGRYLQNGWHSITGTGPTLDEGLANDYPGDRRVGVVAGVTGRIQLGDEPLHGYAAIGGQLAAGTGVTSAETAVGGSASTRHVGVHVEAAITRYHVADSYLALPGGYGGGWQLEWRAGVHVAWSRFRVTYQYRANEGGSGEPIGMIAFQSRR